MRTSLLALLLVACNAKDEGGDSNPTTTDDVDGDGFAVPADCDDDDSAVHPEAAEVCDDVDNNCDGSVDEGVTTVYFEDADGDGYGLDDATTPACSPPDGFAAEGGDCDDTDSLRNPGGTEVCNDADDDCDTEIDEAASDATLWYTDGDLDSFGDDGDAVMSCEAVAGRIAVGGDCDDASDLVNPDAFEVCDGIDNDCDDDVDADDVDVADAGTWYTDSDADGYGDTAAATVACEQPKGTVGNDTDCDDTDAAINPLANEICDFVDDDCDGLVDSDDPDSDGVPRYYADDDGDGFGNESIYADECFAPTGYVDNADDCDDTDASVTGPGTYYRDTDGDGWGATFGTEDCTPPGSGYVTVTGDCRNNDATVYPGATEICDDQDNNCDGAVDDDDKLVVLDVWYGDTDGDGYGETADTFSSCDGATGYVLLPDDCDDDDTAIYPAAPEYCDSKDNDCDGSTDDSVLYVDWYADDDADTYGDPGDVINDCTQPSGYILEAGDCDDATDSVSPEDVEVCRNDTDDDCDGVVDDCAFDLAGANLVLEGDAGNQYLGTTVATGDWNDDGTPDVAAGASSGGYAAVMYSEASGTVSTADADARVSGTAAGMFGYSTAGGDMDEDGVDDLVIGAPGSTVRTAYVFLGPITGDIDTSSAGAALSGTAANAYTGAAVALVDDLDGDGSVDVAVGEPYGGTSYRGVTYVVQGPASGAVDLSTSADWTFTGASTFGYTGFEVVDLGDVDGDGLSELGVGGQGYGGTFYVIAGGTAAGSYDIGVAAEATITGASSDYLGASGGSIDYDQDGYDDLLVGAYFGDGTLINSGLVYGFLAPLSGALTATDSVVQWEGDRANGYFGMTVSRWPGDIDADGNPDVLIGAPYGGESGWGAAYVGLGPTTGVISASGMIRLDATGSSERAGSAVGWLAGWDGDSGDDLVVGAEYASVSGVVGRPGRVSVVTSDNFF